MTIKQNDEKFSFKENSRPRWFCLQALLDIQQQPEIFNLTQPVPEYRREHSPAESSVTEDQMRKETHLSVL